ncbi:hypothetical protein [Candidatus Accumulibacter sp. ACC003]|uniref:hypothetical protein n=1 Tax=Candidatus Accumulibacter sp. ACC003 TaxID=2823334 RepID=UPI0025B9FE85|nr:hypothetical protein [Candidatus Accumulibacter sp. ACC003]
MPFGQHEDRVASLSEGASVQKAGEAILLGKQFLKIEGAAEAIEKVSDDDKIAKPDAGIPERYGGMAERVLRGKIDRQPGDGGNDADKKAEAPTDVPCADANGNRVEDRNGQFIAGREVAGADYRDEQE